MKYVKFGYEFRDKEASRNWYPCPTHFMTPFLVSAKSRESSKFFAAFLSFLHVVISHVVAYAFIISIKVTKYSFNASRVFSVAAGAQTRIDCKTRSPPSSAKIDYKLYRIL